MLSTLFEGSTIPVTQEMLSFSEARHELLVGNIANLDTPGYQVRDFSVETFQKHLSDAIEFRKQRHEPLSSGMPQKRQDPLDSVSESSRHILFHDGSDVGLEQQVTELSKNQFSHNLAIAIMTSQFRLLQTAISERV
jgi:flagellar basal-body rod protein FlgB